MNKFTKSILALGLALSIIVGVGGTSVFAASRKCETHAFINDCYITAVSNLSETSAGANTSASIRANVSVTSTYIYMNVSDLSTHSITKRSTNSKSATVTFSSTKNCRSISIRSTHTAQAYSQYWSATTTCI